MPEISPFRGWRYDPAVAGEVRNLIAPPYDVIGAEGQRALYARSPYNVIRLELTAAEVGDPSGVQGDTARHARARATLDRWMAAGVLRREQGPALYLYEQRFAHAGRSYARRSVLAAARLYPWSAGEILPHEHTLAAPKAERLALLRSTRANISPIWSLYQDGSGGTAALLAAAIRSGPAVEARDDAGVEHSMRVIDDRPAIERIVAAIGAGPVFIADGHHRYETALAYLAGGPEDQARRSVLMALTAADDPGLIVLPTHRMLAGLPPERLAALAEQLGRWFAIQDLGAQGDAAALAARIEEMLPGREGPASEHRFALLGPEPDRLRLLRLLDRSAAGTPPTPAVGTLDVWLAHALILERGLGIDAETMARQEHVTYTRDAAEAIRAVRSGTQQVALFLAPTPVSQLLEVARSGGVMPQKSTYFYPKLATGLVLRLLE